MLKHFINITNPQSPIQCANLLFAIKKCQQPLTPDFCQEILAASNNPRIIKDLCFLISQHLAEAPQEYPNYQNIIFSFVAHRQQPPQAIKCLTDIVSTYGTKVDKTQFKQLIASSPYITPQTIGKTTHQEGHIYNEKDFSAYTHMTIKNDTHYITFNKAKLPLVLDLKPYNNLETFSLFDSDLSTLKVLFFSENIKALNISGCTNIPEILDLSPLKSHNKINISDNDFTGNKIFRLSPLVKELSFNRNRNLPQIIDLSLCNDLEKLIFDTTNFSGVKQLVFPQNLQFLYLNNIQGCPHKLDLTPCSKMTHLEFFENNFKGCHNLSLPSNIQYFKIFNCRSIPETIDLSNITSPFRLSINNTSFRKKSNVFLPKTTERLEIISARTMPSKLNLSHLKNCERIHLAKCNMKNCILTIPRNIKTLNIFNCSNMPEKLDLSHCNKLEKLNLQLTANIKRLILPKHLENCRTGNIMVEKDVIISYSSPLPTILAKTAKSR